MARRSEEKTFSLKLRAFPQALFTLRQSKEFFRGTKGLFPGSKEQLLAQKGSLPEEKTCSLVSVDFIRPNCYLGPS
jgi:hypothetical protein